MTPTPLKTPYLRMSSHLKHVYGSGSMHSSASGPTVVCIFCSVPSPASLPPRGILKTLVLPCNNVARSPDTSVNHGLVW